MWVAGIAAAELEWVEPTLHQTTTLQLATGVVNVWSAPAKSVAESFHRIERTYPGRFLLGIGAGHAEMISNYRNPYRALVECLDRLDDYGVPAERRVVVALGPRVLQLSAQRSAGAHPHLTTPKHTARARELIGRLAFLAPEHKVVLTTDAVTARAVGRKGFDFCLDLTNYVNNLRRMGFADEEITRPGSDRLVDALVTYGTPEAIAARLNEHHAAGADHVAIRILKRRDEEVVSALAQLAAPLGLNPVGASSSAARIDG